MAPGKVLLPTSAKSCSTRRTQLVETPPACRSSVSTLGVASLRTPSTQSSPSASAIAAASIAGRNDGIAAILRDLIRPRAAYIAARSEHMPAVESVYRLQPGPQMVRMWVDRGHFRPLPADCRRLLPVDVGELNRLYQLGFASWLPSSAIAEGVYYGLRVGGRLVSAAGTHVVSREARLAVVGNVFTLAEHRGKGYATAVTGAVTAELLRYCDEAVLNVRADNPPALQAYRRLGYLEHVRFEERLARRLGSPFPDLGASLRRLFSSRRESRPS